MQKKLNMQMSGYYNEILIFEQSVDRQKKSTDGFFFQFLERISISIKANIKKSEGTTVKIRTDSGMP